MFSRQAGVGFQGGQQGMHGGGAMPRVDEDEDLGQ